jgi:hypothetical protein
MPDADAVSLLYCAPPSCVATSVSVFEAERVSASAVIVGALLTCAAIVAKAQAKVGAKHNNFTLFSNSRYSNYKVLSAALMFWNPPARQQFGNAQPLGPGSPLGFELGNDIPNTNLQEFARHVLLSVSNIVIAIWKDAHPHEPLQLPKRNCLRRR